MARRSREDYPPSQDELDREEERDRENDFYEIQFYIPSMIKDLQDRVSSLEKLAREYKEREEEASKL